MKSPVSPSKQQCPVCAQVFVAELGTMSLGLGRAPQVGLALVAPGGPLVLGLCLVLHKHSPDGAQGTFSQSWNSPPTLPPSLLRVPWMGISTGLSPLGRGTEPGLAWSLSLPGKLVGGAVPDCRYTGLSRPSAPKHAPPTGPRKRKVPVATTRQLLPFLECLLWARRCVKSPHGSL